MKKVTKTQNSFLDIYIIIATIILIFAMFISNYTLIDNHTYKPFQQVKGIDEICGVSTRLEDVKISYLENDNLIVFSRDDKYKIIEILSSLSIRPETRINNEKKPDNGIIIIDNLAERKHVKISFNNSHIYISGKEYDISTNLYYNKLKEVISKNV